MSPKSRDRVVWRSHPDLSSQGTKRTSVSLVCPQFTDAPQRLGDFWEFRSRGHLAALSPSFPSAHLRDTWSLMTQTAALYPELSVCQALSSTVHVTSKSSHSHLQEVLFPPTHCPQGGQLKLRERESHPERGIAGTQASPDQTLKHA